jgi:hypothetical protein
MVHDKAQKIYKTTENVAATLTSLAIETDAEWPLVDIPLSCGRNNELSKALMISYSPLVTTGRVDWEDHAFATRAGFRRDRPRDLHEGYRMISSSPTFRKTSSVYGRCDRFACHTGSPLCRLWTWTLRTCMGTGAGPHDPSIINFDLLSPPSSTASITECGRRGYLSCRRLLI